MRKSSFGRKRKNNIGATILMVVLMLLFGGTTGVLAYKIPAKVNDFKETKLALTNIKEANTAAEASLSEYTAKIEQIQKELKLKEVALKEAQEANPDLVVDNTSGEKYAYLTFDDGPSENTEKILDFLKANNIHATFFVLGKDGEEDIYRRIVDEGHTLAIHSNTHNYDEIYQSVDAFMDDISVLSEKIESATGTRPTILRFPGGSNNTIGARYGGKDVMDKIISAVTKAGYTYFDWNVDSLDASKNRQDKDVIVKSVLDGARNKDEAIILMHDAQPKTTTVEALPEIVEGLRKQGFSFKVITEDTPQVKFK